MAMELGGASANKTRPAPDMNVTPLIDVVLVLLIIFMAMTPVAARRFYVHTPKQEKQEVDQPPADPQPPLVLRLAADGGITINGVALRREEVPERLRRMFAARTDHVLFFDAADDVPFAEAMRAMDAARAGGAVTIATLTQPLSAPAAAP
jgi:biopolymer transport protein ExbD/biopolymer transport protein TolR